jgi:hypothetical protein
MVFSFIVVVFYCLMVYFGILSVMLSITSKHGTRNQRIQKVVRSVFDAMNTIHECEHPDFDDEVDVKCGDACRHPSERRCSLRANDSDEDSTDSEDTFFNAICDAHTHCVVSDSSSDDCGGGGGSDDCGDGETGSATSEQFRSREHYAPFASAKRRRRCLSADHAR